MVLALTALAGSVLAVVPFSEPVWQGKRLTAWIKLLKVSVRVVEHPREWPDETLVFLGNLSDDEVFRLNSGLPKVRVVPSNFELLHLFDTNAPNYDSTAICGVAEAETAPAHSAIQHLGTRAVPALIAGLHRRDSKAIDFFNLRVRSLLPQMVQRALGKPFHPTHMRWNCAYALGVIGPAAKPAVPELRKLLNDPEPFVRAAALEALQRIDPDQAGQFHAELFLTDWQLQRHLVDGKGERASRWQPRLQFLPERTGRPDFLGREKQFPEDRQSRKAEIDESEPLLRSEPMLIRAGTQP